MTKGQETRKRPVRLTSEKSFKGKDAQENRTNRKEEYLNTGGKVGLGDEGNGEVLENHEICVKVT